MRRRDERAAWTALVTGEKQKTSKYGNDTSTGFASKKEARIAQDLQSLERSGNIRNLKMQVPIILVEGKDKVRGITYIADFTYDDLDGTKHILDAKGMRTAIFILKKKMAFLLHGIVIEEV